MQVTNFKQYGNIPFDEYIKLPGISYSSIKGFSGPPNKGMSLGSHVHQYLLEPKEYKWEDVAMVKDIAFKLRSVLGSTLELLELEEAFTADFTYNGMIMAYKGRVDMLKVGRLVVDLKILGGALKPAMQYFGYSHQVSGYCLATGSPMGIIVAYNRSQKKVETEIIKPSGEFWKYQCVHRGEPSLITI